MVMVHLTTILTIRFKVMFLILGQTSKSVGVPITPHLIIQKLVHTIGKVQVNVLVLLTNTH